MSLGQGTIFSPNIDSALLPKFHAYLELLKKWNKVYNLTAITDDEEIVIKHFEDSLSPLPFLSKSGRLLDIGCGGGFPGIPLKIASPSLEIVLLDSILKKIQFCETVIRELNLKNIRAFQGRAEDSKMIEQLGLFDVVISRATASVEDLLALSEHYLKKEGMVIAMKGPEWKKESIPQEKWELAETKDYELRKDLGKRTLLVFKVRHSGESRNPELFKNKNSPPQ